MELTLGILALLTAIVGGGVIEHETQIVTQVIMYPVDTNQTECLKSSKIMLK
jgi:hypothetical protein